MLKKLLLIFCTHIPVALASYADNPILTLLNPESLTTFTSESVTTTHKSRVEKLEEVFDVEFWQDEFYRAHSAGVQNLLIHTSNQTLLEDYLNSLIRLCISQDSVKTIFVGPPSDWAERSRIYRRLRDNIKPNGFILRNFHRWETPDDLPDEIPSLFNGEKYSGILLPEPSQNGYRKYHKYLKSVQGILYVPFGWWQKQSVIKQLIKDGFQKRYIMVANGMIMACSSDPSQFSKSLLYPAHPRPESALDRIRKYFQLITDGQDTGHKQ